MKALVLRLIALTPAFLAGAASAHETALPHSHPHPALVGGDAILLAALLCLAALIAFSLRGGAR